MKKKTEQGWVDSTSLKITFTCSNLPEAVVIGYSYYKVRPYIGEPLQCYKCQRLGHTAGGCRGRTRCLLCGENHTKDVCKAEEFRCANCKGNHKANSRKCDLFYTACQIESVRALQNETYLQARKQVLTQQSSSSNLNSHEIQAEFHHSINSQTVNNTVRNNNKYSDIVKAITHRTIKSSNSCATQTDDCITEASTMKNLPENFFDKLRKCLIELFQSSVLKENKRSQSLIVESAIRNSFNLGKEVSENLGLNTGFKHAEPITTGIRRPREETDEESSGLDKAGVISQESDLEEEPSDSETLWETREKTVVKKKNQQKKAKLNAKDNTNYTNQDLKQNKQTRGKNNKKVQYKQ